MLLITSVSSAFLYTVLNRNLKLERQVSLKTQELENLAIRDSLTGLFNRRRFFEIIHTYVNRYQRMKEPFTIAMIDLDHFKEINDTYGHDVGDFVLKSFSKFMTERIRSNDILIRYGGEEFIVIFENATMSLAKEVLDRILAELNDTLHVQRGHSISITFSAGIADCTETEDVYTLIKYSDIKMYSAKESGRNCIVL